VEVSHYLTEAIKDVDVIMVLRIQLELSSRGQVKLDNLFDINHCPPHKALGI